MEKFLVDRLFNLVSFAHKRVFDGCTYPWEALLKLIQYLESQNLGKIECPIPQGVYLINPEQISIGKGTIVEPGTLIKGPCLIGRDCEIRHGAYVRGGVLTGDGCVIGHATEVKGSILLDEAHAAHFNYVGDSILGNRVNLGAGVKLANVRLDGEDVKIGTVATGLKKLGAILGDETQLGCNAVTNPGTVMGKRSFGYPNTVIKYDNRNN
ncbi:MAG: UDP-N-acetylglucosamine diphosphorylase [Verrucomicrobia bacterium]|nr:UDP-N-acetylglucosamine diphosphorylase [Verrucomicrobiota bacterium]